MKYLLATTKYTNIRLACVSQALKAPRSVDIECFLRSLFVAPSYQNYNL